MADLAFHQVRCDCATVLLVGDLNLPNIGLDWFSLDFLADDNIQFIVFGILYSVWVI